MINVRDVDQNALASNSVIEDAVTAASLQLGDTGRVLLRKSGTEPMVRVMVEAAQQSTAEEIAQSLAGVVREQLAR
jgi:phosphoglucosamine mutase